MITVFIGGSATVIGDVNGDGISDILLSSYILEPTLSILIMKRFGDYLWCDPRDTVAACRFYPPVFQALFSLFSL